MKKTGQLLALVLVFSFVLLSGNAYAQEEGATVGAYYSSTTWNTLQGGWLIGQRVYSPLGGDLGQVSDLLVDRSDGHIALVILSDVPGFGSELVAAPFGALERTGQNIFQLSFGERDIPIAPTQCGDQYAYELTRYKDTVGLSTVPSAIDPRWADSVYRFYGQIPYWSDQETRQPQIMSYRTTGPVGSITGLFGEKTTPALMGAMVQSSDGEATGRINDMVIDCQDGRVALLIIGGLPAKGDVQVAVPFAELSMNGNVFVLNTTKDRLAAAPSFNVSADLHNLKWAENVYRFFGQQPYWTEERMR